jgi:hypothetical protein
MSGKKSLQRAYYVNKESEEMDVFKATVNKTSNRQQATVRRELVQRFNVGFIRTRPSVAGKSEALRHQDTFVWDENIDHATT